MTPRVAARAGARPKYFGLPCKHGHDGERYTRSAHCVKCDIAKSARRQAENRAYFAAASKKWREANPEKALDSSRTTHAKFRAERNAASRRYKLENRSRMTALQMQRHVAKLNRTPAWANRKEIQRFYDEARRLSLETGVKHVVDHVIPLQGVRVSGLHVQNNLQIITQSANASKWNRFEVSA